MRERDRTTENATGNGARTMKASEFKTKCLALMDEIAESGEEIVITKYGKPVAKLTPCDRLILATALEGHQLITADAHLLHWPGAVARLDARE